MSIRPVAAAIATALVLTATGCGSSGSSHNNAPPGETARARELLVGIGIKPSEADCLIDELGADTIVEAPDPGVLADGGPYKEAAKKCLSNPTE